MSETKLQLKLGEKGRLIVEATKPVAADSAVWKSYSDCVILDRTGQKTPLDMLVVSAKPGTATVECQVLDTSGDKVLEHTFTIEVSEDISDDDLIGHARVSRESDTFEVPGTVSDEPQPESAGVDGQGASGEQQVVGDPAEVVPSGDVQPVKMGEAMPAPVSTSMQDGSNDATHVGGTDENVMPANEASSVAGEALGATGGGEGADSGKMAGFAEDDVKNAEIEPQDTSAGIPDAPEPPADAPPAEVTVNEAETPAEIAQAEEATQVVGGDVGPDAVSTAAVETGATTVGGPGGAEETAATEPAPDGALTIDSSDKIEEGDAGPKTLEEVEAGSNALEEDDQDNAQSAEAGGPADPNDLAAAEPIEIDGEAEGDTSDDVDPKDAAAEPSRF